jgi:hypothetical protein
MTNTETTTPVVANEAAAPVAKPAKVAKDKPVGTAAKKAAKKPSKPVVTKASAKPAKAAKKAAKPAAKKAKAEAVTGSVIPREVAKAYHRDTKKKTVNGNPSIDNNDKIAQRLRGQTLDTVYELCAKACEVTVKDLKAKYGHLNLGMQRMNLGNKIRAAAA